MCCPVEHLPIFSDIHSAQWESNGVMWTLTILPSYWKISQETSRNNSHCLGSLLKRMLKSLLKINKDLQFVSSFLFKIQLAVVLNCFPLDEIEEYNIEF